MNLRITFLLLGVGLASLSAQAPNSEHTLQADAAGPRPAARLTDFAWLVGHWVGTGFDGAKVEETWLPLDGSSMVGLFRLLSGGRAQVYEMIVLLERDGTVEMRLKHFTRELKGWEEKDAFVSFPLVKRGENEAWFDGLTYRREGDTLRVWLVTRSAGAPPQEQAMVYRRQ